MEFEIHSIVCFVAIIFCFFISALLFKIKLGTRVNNILLGLFLVFFSYHMLLMGLVPFILYFDASFLKCTDMTVEYLVGPLLYLYIKYVSEPRVQFDRKDFLHLLNLIIPLAMLFPIYFITPENPEAFFHGVSTGTNDPAYHFRIEHNANIFLVQVLVYIALTHRLLSRYSRRSVHQNSNHEKVYLSWAKYLLYVITINYIFLAGMIWSTYVASFFGFTLDVHPFHFGLYKPMVSMIVFIIGFKLLMNPELYAANNDLLQPSGGQDRDSKYKKSSLSAEESEKLYRGLLHSMKTQKYYLDPELTLGSLAERVDIPRNHLSEIINKHSGCNFYDFVNKFRVEEARRIISEESEEKMISVAFKSGFNSKNTFNRTFSKYLATSPSNYRKSKGPDRPLI